MTASCEFYEQAAQLRNRIVAKQSNERPVQAWAAVCRACANANNARRREMAAAGQTFAYRSDLCFFNNLDAIWWPAKAQVETITRLAA